MNKTFLYSLNQLLFFIVEYSSDWGKQWNQLSTYNRNSYTPWNDGEQNEADWKPETLLFKAESDTALIRFRFKSNGSIQDAGWSIDDILFSSSTDIKRQDDKQSDFIIYPNPAKESIILSNIFNTYIDKVICYDFLGKEVHRINVNNRMQDMIIMDISSLSNFNIKSFINSISFLSIIIFKIKKLLFSKSSVYFFK